jgi:ribosomal protein L7/L12
MATVEVYCTDLGSRRVEVLKALRADIGVPLESLKSLADNLPLLICRGLMFPEALALEDKYKRLGASTKIHAAD